ncbi:putative retrotransposon ty1-copia subclass protein [Tanacetum coccineum]
MDGAVHTYKARLVAKGFTQTSGIDYEETFSLVVDIRAIRILIAIATFYDYKIWQMDVKTAFLNGYLNEEVTWSNLKVLSARNFQTEYASRDVPFMDLSKHLGNGINVLKMKSRNLDSVKIKMSHVYMLKLVGVMSLS